MSIWLVLALFLAARAVPLAHRRGGTLDKVLYQRFAKTSRQKVGATTTVPPAFLHALAFREANLQEQIDRANQTLHDAEKRLSEITSGMTNVTALIKKINATVNADKSLMNGTSSIIKNLQTQYSGVILEGKLNATKARLAAINATAQNISTIFGANKGAKADHTDINKKLKDLNEIILLNGSQVEEVLNNFSKMEKVLRYNVSEWIEVSMEHQVDGVMDNISERFASLVKSQGTSLKERPCDLVPNITNCVNSTANATKASTATAAGFLQVLNDWEKVAIHRQRSTSTSLF